MLPLLVLLLAATHRYSTTLSTRARTHFCARRILISVSHTHTHMPCRTISQRVIANINKWYTTLHWVVCMCGARAISCVCECVNAYTYTTLFICGTICWYWIDLLHTTASRIQFVADVLETQTTKEGENEFIAPFYSKTEHMHWTYAHTNAEPLLRILCVCVLFPILCHSP